MRTRDLRPTLLAALAMIALGLPDGLTGVAWPSMRSTFDVPLDALGALLASFTLGYVAASFGGGWLLRRLGLGRLLVVSCALTGASLFGYANTDTWMIAPGLAFVAGLGAGGIDAAVNTYAATWHGPRMLNALHACYGIGASSGPATMTAVLAAALPWQRGFVLVGALQLAFAALFAANRRAWPTAPPAGGDQPAADAASLGATLRLAATRRGMLLFFAYTGLELAIGAWSFTLLTEGRGRSPEFAGLSVSLYWAGLTGGRVLGAAVGMRLSAAALVRSCALVLTLALGVVAAGFGCELDTAGLVLAGTAAGPVFPTLIATTPARVGTAHTGNAIGLQIGAAAIGQALLPTLLGVAGRRFGLEVLAGGLVALAALVVALHAIASPRAHAVGVRVFR